MSTMVNSAEEAWDGNAAQDGINPSSITASITGIPAKDAGSDGMMESGANSLSCDSVLQTGCRDRIATQGRTNLPPATASATRISAIDRGPRRAPLLCVAGWLDAGWGRMAEFRRNFRRASQPDGKTAPDGTKTVSVLPSDLIISAIHAAADGRTELVRICGRSSASIAESRNSRIVFGDVNHNINRSQSPSPPHSLRLQIKPAKFFQD